MISASDHVRMPIHYYTGGHVFTNGYIIEYMNTCVVVDAPALIHQLIKENDFNPTHLLLTHQHFDHTEDVSALKKLGLKILMHSPYSEALIRQKEARENWGLPVQIDPFSPDALLKDKSDCSIGELTLKIAHVPGHSPDSIIFYFPALNALFAGDTLMRGSIGRTDLPGGSEKELLEGIRSKIYTLPDDTLVCAGHGEPTTIAEEKKHNPFV